MTSLLRELLSDLLDLAKTRSWKEFHNTRSFHACRQIFLYGIIGGSCATLDFVIYFILSNTTNWTPSILKCVDIFRETFHIAKDSVPLLYSAHWNIYFPNFVSINIGILCSFLLNAFFNFKRSDKLWRRALKFFAVGYCGLVLSMLILRIGVVRFDFDDKLVKLFSVFFVAALQFILNKFITFNKTKIRQPGEQPIKQPDESSNHE